MADGNYSGAYTRQYYRVSYPENERPSLSFGGKRFDIINISEMGGMFQYRDAFRLGTGARLKGVITFRDGDAIDIEGEILREFEDKFVVCFKKGIPFGRILKEQRYLKDKFKHLIA